MLVVECFDSGCRPGGGDFGEVAAGRRVWRSGCGEDGLMLKCWDPVWLVGCRDTPPSPQINKKKYAESPSRVTTSIKPRLTRIQHNTPVSKLVKQIKAERNEPLKSLGCARSQAASRGDQSQRSHHSQPANRNARVLGLQPIEDNLLPGLWTQYLLAESTWLKITSLELIQSTAYQEFYSFSGIEYVENFVWKYNVL